MSELGAGSNRQRPPTNVREPRAAKDDRVLEGHRGDTCQALVSARRGAVGHDVVLGRQRQLEAVDHEREGRQRGDVG